MQTMASEKKGQFVRESADISRLITGHAVNNSGDNKSALHAYEVILFIVVPLSSVLLSLALCLVSGDLYKQFMLPVPACSQGLLTGRYDRGLSTGDCNRVLYVVAVTRFMDRFISFISFLFRMFL